MGGEDPLEKGMATHSSILTGEFHGQRSLVGYSPWDRKESEMTEQLSTQVILHKPASLAKGLFSKLEGLN